MDISQLMDSQKTFDFDIIVDRKGSGSVKWDEPTAVRPDEGSDDIIPMWVADMDFPTAPVVVDALRRRVEHGIFGYTHVPEAYYDAVCRWFSRRHGVEFRREWIVYTSGVVPAISAVLKALCAPGDRVLVQTPVYNCFFSSIRNDELLTAESPLRRTDGAPFTYEVDFDSFERECAHPHTRVFLLCNPHNPAGRVWTRSELERMWQICRRHGVTVVADEIHCELVQPGYRYTPFASGDPDAALHSVTLCSPTKAFNIAGLQIANIVCADGEMRRRIDRAINVNEVCDVNPFGVEALMAAYGGGEPWLDALNAYLADNYRTLVEFFASHLPHLPVARLEGTYLVWVDVSAMGMDGQAVADRLLREARVRVSAGAMYGAKAGRDYIRINIACPRSRMMEGLRRVARTLVPAG